MVQLAATAPATAPDPELALDSDPGPDSAPRPAQRQDTLGLPGAVPVPASVIGFAPGVGPNLVPGPASATAPPLAMAET